MFTAAVCVLFLIRVIMFIYINTLNYVRIEAQEIFHTGPD